MCQQLPYQEESILENAQINFSVYNCVMSFKQVALLLQFHSKYTLQEFHDSFCLQNFILYSSSGGIPSSSSVKSKGSIHSISPWKTNNIFQNYIHVVLTQGLVRAGGTGGMPPVNFSQQVASTRQIRQQQQCTLRLFRILIIFNPLFCDCPPII